MSHFYNEQNVVVIGGGTGLSTMLKGIKDYTHNITAVVTVADNGGGSGKIREEMGIMPPGDIRNCLVALANTEPIMEKLLQHRFKEGSLEGQSFGNLLLAALTEITGSFEEAVHVTSNVLAITGKVYPVTLEDVHLHAFFEDGNIVIGECQIVEYGKISGRAIKKIELIPKMPPVNEAVICAIKNADKIILGPGSLYTSIIPNLLVKDICNHIANSKAEKIFVANIMTQPGETSNLTLEQHLLVLQRYLGNGILDKVIVNNAEIKDEYVKKYILDGANVIKIDSTNKIWNNIKCIKAPLIDINEKKQLIRHDSKMLARCIFEEV